MVKITSYNDAINAYEKFKNNSKGFLGLNFSDKGNLKNFSEIQKENGAFSSSKFNDIKNVSIDKIRGSVQKYMDFDKDFVPINEIIQDRWCRLYLAYLNGTSLPPVQLYKIKDDYFVYDGNHRVSVANFLNFSTLESEVTEFIPSSDTKENAIYRENFLFSKSTGIDNIEFTEVGQYDIAEKEIEHFIEYLDEKESILVSKLEGAKLWYSRIYLPVIEIFKENKVLDGFKNRTYSDLFLYLLQHKYFESKKRGYDVGLSYSVINFINFLRSNEENLIDKDKEIELSDNFKENIKDLQNIDRKLTLDSETINKLEIIENVTKVNFEYDFFILFDIEDYIKKNKIKSFNDGVLFWFDNCFKYKLKQLSKKIELLPEYYIEKAKDIFINEEKTYFALHNFQDIYEERIKHDSEFSEVLANYIIEIYLNSVEILEKKSIDRKYYSSVFFGIQERYNYLLGYNKKASILDAAEYYFNSTVKKYQKIQDWFIIKFYNSSKTKQVIDYLIENIKDLSEKESDLREVFKKYGVPKKYGTIFRLERSKEYFDKLYPNKNWLTEKLIKDLDILLESEEIFTYFKTQEVMNSINDEDGMSMIDLYADIMDYGNYLEKELAYINIIDLALEYKNRDEAFDK